MSNQSMLSAVKKLRALLTREEKFVWVKIICFAICTSSLEVVTASVIMIFAQVLNQPAIGAKYLAKLGFIGELPQHTIVLYMGIIVGLVYIIKNVTAGIEIFYQNFSIQKMNYKFKNKLLNRYAESDYNYYLTRNSSQGMQVVGSDSDLMFQSGMLPLANILSEGTVFFLLIAMVIWMNPSLAFLILFIGSILCYTVSKFLLPKFYMWGQRLQKASLQSSHHLQQFFHAFKEIVLLGKKDEFVGIYRNYAREKSEIHATQNAINNLPRVVIEILFVCLFVATVSFLCLNGENSAQMLAILGGYLYVGFRLMPGLNRLINQLNIFKVAIPYIEIIYTEYNTVVVRENYIDVPDFVFEKSIVLNNVNFNYTNTNKNALQKISLQINKGECLGIIGETGSGKSTLVDLILGLLRPYVGTVLVDNKFPVNSLQWHKKIGYVSQSIYLIDDTIAANIAFGVQDIDEAKLNAAIEVAQLSKLIAQLPEGCRTLVGERGIRLSGGERQRIAIARALYRDPEVLIFDEATSALDTDTEARLMNAVHNVTKNRTVIMIAHRLTTLKNCDRIVALDAGVIKSITTHNSFA